MPKDTSDRPPADRRQTRTTHRRGVGRCGNAFAMGFGGGKVTGDLSVDARTDNPTSRVDLQYDAVDLAAFFRGSRFFDTTNGKLTGRIVLDDGGRIGERLDGQSGRSAARQCADALYH